MAKQILQDCRIFVGSADLSGWSNKVEIKRAVEDKDVTNFRSGGAKEFIGGLGSSVIDVEGMFEATDLTMPDDVLDPNVGVVGPWTVTPNDSVVGALAYLLNVLEGGYVIGGAVGDVAPFKASGVGSWPRARGAILSPPGAARTVTGVGTSVQLGATAAGKYLYLALHVLSVAGTGSPTITVRVEGDNSGAFSSPITLATFTAATAPGGQILRVAGPVTDDWLRAAWTVSGSSPSFLAVVAAGIA